MVTGATGFTGRPLMAAMAARGWTVRGFSHDRGGPDDRQGSLLDVADVTGAVEAFQPDVVVHLAGITFAAHPVAAEVYAVNVVGTANLLGALQALSKPPRLTIVASSATVYAQAQGPEPIGEDHPLQPLNHYGASKLAVEHMARIASARMPIQVVRPFNYTGPGQTPEFLAPKIVKHYAEGAAVMEIGNLDLDRDIGVVDDVVETYVRLIERGEAGPPLNICTGQALHLRDLIGAMEAISGRTLEVRVNPKFVRQGEPKVMIGDRARLDAAIGAWPRRPLTDALAQMYRLTATA